jgi:hypothetical protein
MSNGYNNSSDLIILFRRIVIRKDRLTNYGPIMHIIRPKLLAPHINKSAVHRFFNIYKKLVKTPLLYVQMK